MDLKTKRDDPQFCREEVAGELALCKILRIPFDVDEAGIAHISVGRRSVGVVVIAWDDALIEVDLQHIRDLGVDIVAFARVRMPEVSLLGWLDTTRIFELCAGGSRLATSLPMDSLEDIRQLIDVAGDE